MSRNALRALLSFAVAAAAQTGTFTTATITNGSTTPAAQLQLGSTTATGSKIWSNSTTLNLTNQLGYGFRITNDTAYLMGTAAGPTKIAGEGPIVLRRTNGAVRQYGLMKLDTVRQYFTNGGTTLTSDLRPGNMELYYGISGTLVTGGMSAAGNELRLYTKGSCCGQYASPNRIVIGNIQGTTMNPWMTVAGGTTAKSANVTIDGDARVNGKLFIGTTGWSVSAPDYVFAEEYKLAPLHEVESFVRTNRHLPGIESAKAMEEKGGVDLVQMNLDLLKKVEELTLYVIDQNKKIEALQAERGIRN